MPKKIKYITIGMPVDYDAVRNLPKSEQNPERVMNIIGPQTGSIKTIHPVSLNKALCPEYDYLQDGSTIPEISLADVENFIKGSDFVLIVTSIGFRREYKVAIEVIKLVKEKGIPFHVLLARPLSFAMDKEVVEANDPKIEAITENVTKTNVYSDMEENASPDMSTKEAFKQIADKLYAQMQEILK